jgi:hypothetical protein
MVDDPGIWFGVAIALVICAYLVAGALRLDPVETASAAIVVAGLAATRLPSLVTVALGVVAWAFFTGFIENAFGQLTFAGHDLEHLAVFAGATAVVGLAGRSLMERSRADG